MKYAIIVISILIFSCDNIPNSINEDINKVNMQNGKIKKYDMDIDVVSENEITFRLKNISEKSLFTNPIRMNKNKVYFFTPAGKRINPNWSGTPFNMIQINEGETYTWTLDVTADLSFYNIDKEEWVDLIWVFKGVQSEPVRICF